MAARRYGQPNIHLPSCAWMLRTPYYELPRRPAACVSNSAIPKVGKNPPPPFFDKTTGVVLLCGESSKPNPLDASPPASNTPSCSVSEAYGKSLALAKAPASCPPKLKGPTPVGERGAASPPPQLGRTRGQRGTGEQRSLPHGGHREGPRPLAERPCVTKDTE